MIQGRSGGWMFNAEELANAATLFADRHCTKHLLCAKARINRGFCDGCKTSAAKNLRLTYPLTACHAEDS